jgi:hypothetical protein
MPSTAEWGLITTGIVGIAGIAGTTISAHLQRKHDRSMAREDRIQGRQATAYVDALAIMDRYLEIDSRNVLPDGKGADNEGEPSTEELARNAGRIRAFGSQSAYDAWRQFENKQLAFYRLFDAADRFARQKPEGVADTEEAIRARMALANALDQLRDAVKSFEAIVRDDLGTD